MKCFRKIYILPILLLIFLWFFCFDRSIFLEGCEDCLFRKEIIQYRIFSIPIHEKVLDHHSAIELMAIDLGYPCPHRDYQKTHLQRYWGGCICMYPCISGTFLFTGPSRYNDDIARRLKALSIVKPDLGKDFKQKVIFEHNIEYLNSILNEANNLIIDPLENTTGESN